MEILLVTITSLSQLLNHHAGLVTLAIGWLQIATTIVLAALFNRVPREVSLASLDGSSG